MTFVSEISTSHLCLLYESNQTFFFRSLISFQKGPGYHLDFLVVGLLITLCSLLGLPWVVGATVRSVTHVNSLHVVDKNTAPGEKPHFLGVR